MHVSLNWIKDYLNIDLPPEKVGEILTSIGLEVEGMEKVESIKGGLEGVVVGYVTSCEKHPNADRLSLTKVDIGVEKDLQIICGAPNVAKGQKVLVATVDTTLYSAEGEPWTVKKGKIRGETSEGMICAEDELGLGDNHDGIMVLPKEVETGTLAKTYFNIENDYVYEIGLTPNRSDATNHLGVAKDLAAALKINFDSSVNIKMPDLSRFQISNYDLPVEVVVENEEACPRYAGVTIKGLTIKDSPDWLKNRLNAIGVRPINNVVDITNFVLHEYGQPLHAFDLDKVRGHKIIVKTLPANTTFTTLDEVERKLDAEDLMICNGDADGMCIGGVFGGLKSGITDQTTTIFLESAHFNPKWIRRTSMRHNLRTDAAKVFEKGSDPNVVIDALKRAAILIHELAGGIVSSDIIDIYPTPITPKEIRVRYDRVNKLIGVEIAKEDIRAILEAMEMEITKEEKSAFTVAVPTNKSDVLREIDVIEEILRIYDFNKVPISNQISTSITISPKPDPSEIRNIIGDFLTANGFYEMMAVSLSQSKYYQENTFSIAVDNLVFINNTSNIHLDIMRPEMLMSGLEAVIHNQNRQQNDLKLYEFGKSYQMDKEDEIIERSHLSLILTGKRSPESWLNPDNRQTSFYTLKTYVENILKRLGITGYQESVLDDTVFLSAIEYHRGPQQLVRFGRVNPKISKSIDIRHAVYFADFHWDNILKALKKHKIIFEELNKFPATRRDLALIVDNSVKFSDIVALANKVGKKLLTHTNLFDVYENEEQIGEGKKSYAVSFLFEDHSKTLKDKEVDKVINKLIQEYEAKLGAIIRR